MELFLLPFLKLKKLKYQYGGGPSEDEDNYKKILIDLESNKNIERIKDTISTLQVEISVNENKISKLLQEINEQRELQKHVERDLDKALIISKIESLEKEINLLEETKIVQQTFFQKLIELEQKISLSSNNSDNSNLQINNLIEQNNGFLHNKYNEHLNFVNFNNFFFKYYESLNDKSKYEEMYNNLITQLQNNNIDAISDILYLFVDDLTNGFTKIVHFQYYISQVIRNNGREESFNELLDKSHLENKKRELKNACFWISIRDYLRLKGHDILAYDLKVKYGFPSESKKKWNEETDFLNPKHLKCIHDFMIEYKIKINIYGFSQLENNVLVTNMKYNLDKYFSFNRMILPPDDFFEDEIDIRYTGGHFDLIVSMKDIFTNEFKFNQIFDSLPDDHKQLYPIIKFNIPDN